MPPPLTNHPSIPAAKPRLRSADGWLFSEEETLLATELLSEDSSLDDDDDSTLEELGSCSELETLDTTELTVLEDDASEETDELTLLLDTTEDDELLERLLSPSLPPQALNTTDTAKIKERFFNMLLAPVRREITCCHKPG
ncbi:hypothetical protein CJA_0449 [Cellvibrio japonicus Ueda107]|uniref:Uncharacterized protein n=1 Tax=Cellvibrio japonicus (strain Ueda107) TaxID=498211 RepID=B3PIA9_CELJU|nr:hypothetical protein CJA_0449 [Cellvibrio japonicus Ueda107]